MERTNKGHWAVDTIRSETGNSEVSGRLPNGRKMTGKFNPPDQGKAMSYEAMSITPSSVGCTEYMGSVTANKFIAVALFLDLGRKLF